MIARPFPALSLCCALLASCRSKPTLKDADQRSPEAGAPTLTKPNVRRTWIPKKIEEDGRTMDDGHWRYSIERGSSWSK